MKFPIYTSTQGLDRYPEHERFSVYCAMHKRLMSEDASYRRQWNSYVGGIVCVAVIPAGSFFLGGALGVSLSVAGVVYLAFRQQKFMNQRVGDALRHQSAQRARL